MFILGTSVAAVSPKYAIYFWLLAFGGLFVGQLLNLRAS